MSQLHDLIAQHYSAEVESGGGGAYLGRPVVLGQFPLLYPESHTERSSS